MNTSGPRTIPKFLIETIPLPALPSPRQPSSPRRPSSPAALPPSTTTSSSQRRPPPRPPSSLAAPTPSALSCCAYQVRGGSRWRSELGAATGSRVGRLGVASGGRGGAGEARGARSKREMEQGRPGALRLGALDPGGRCSSENLTRRRWREPSLADGLTAAEQSLLLVEKRWQAWARCR